VVICTRLYVKGLAHFLAVIATSLKFLVRVVVDIDDRGPRLGKVNPVSSLQQHNDTAQPPQTRLCTRPYAAVLEEPTYLFGLSNDAHSLTEPGGYRVWRGVAAASGHSYFTHDEWMSKKARGFFG
jgi:hypothetical protein